MPTVREIEQALFRLAPKEGAMDWDNVGQLLGDPEAEVRRVLVALDITEAVADEAIAENCQLIVSHHPVMNWQMAAGADRPAGHAPGAPAAENPEERPVRHLYAHEPGCGPRRRQRRAGRRAGAGGPWAAGGPGGAVPDGNTGKSYAFTGICKARLPGAPGQRRPLRRGQRPVRKVAVGGGACGDYEDAAIAAGCDVFVTSDLSYHQFLDAAGKGIRLIDAGHFPTEEPVCTVLAEYLRGRFPGLTVTKSASHREVIQYYVEGE